MLKCIGLKLRNKSKPIIEFTIKDKNKMSCQIEPQEPDIVA